MSLTNRNSGTHFLTLSAYNRFRMFSSRRSDSSISDAESMQSSQAAEKQDNSFNSYTQGSTGDCLPAQRTEGEILSPPNLKAVTFNEPSYTQGSSGECLPTQRTEGEILSAPNLKAFTLNELISATRNFCPESLIGEEVFGYVFKGWIDELTFTASKPGVGMVVAVKKFKPEVFHGHNAWLTEVCYLGQLHHPNLVKVIGFCSDGDNRLLVYEFMPRGGLDNHLFGRGVQPLSWATRIKVAIGAAKGLTFLHDAQSQVIYQDVKSSNILLDSDFDAKLSGIGLARAGPTWDMTHVIQCGRGSGWVDELDLVILWMNMGIWFSHPSDLWNMTNVPPGVLGTLGYAAPEYIATGHSSTKADVYSFGVVLLELLSGRRAYDGSKSGAEQHIVDWARPYLGDKRKLFRIMDSKLEGQFPKKVAHAMVNLVSVCIGNDPKLRPPMSKVLAVLEKFQK